MYDEESDLVICKSCNEVYYDGMVQIGVNQWRNLTYCPTCGVRLDNTGEPETHEFLVLVEVEVSMAVDGWNAYRDRFAGAIENARYGKVVGLSRQATNAFQDVDIISEEDIDAEVEVKIAGEE